MSQNENIDFDSEELDLEESNYDDNEASYSSSSALCYDHQVEIKNCDFCKKPEQEVE